MIKTPFSPEPSFTHGQTPRTAVLYCNLGTPDSPSTADVRRFLAEFLSDQRVVEIPRAVWWFILNLVILPFRSGQSAKKYASIWTREGSPLKVFTQKQATLLAGWLGERGHRVTVRDAMRYANPSIASRLDALQAEGATRVLVLQAYPQYSATTTASVIDAVNDWSRKQRRLPEFRFVNDFHDDPAYIEALAQGIEKHWKTEGRGEVLLMSFHGIPARNIALGDPYQSQCLETARLLAARLGLSAAQHRVTFQSRFGKAEWLQPYTAPTVAQLARAGVKRLDVLCPGFTSDCLETLEEISLEVRHEFEQAGGQ
eukprot:gene44714-59678_t